MHIHVRVSCRGSGTRILEFAELALRLKQLQIQGRTAFPTTETYAMWNAHTILFFYFAENSHFLRSGKFCNVTSKSALLFFNIAGATFLQKFMQYGLCF